MDELVIIITLFFSGLYSGAETAFVSVNRLHIEVWANQPLNPQLQKTALNAATQTQHKTHVVTGTTFSFVCQSSHRQ